MKYILLCLYLLSLCWGEQITDTERAIPLLKKQIFIYQNMN
jgi:hypothetical protein